MHDSSFPKPGFSAHIFEKYLIYSSFLISLTRTSIFYRYFAACFSRGICVNKRKLTAYKFPGLE
jgi:hypothetical protein